MTTVPTFLDIVTLGVADVQRSAGFFEQLGWKRCDSSQDEIVWFETSGSYLGLFGRADLAHDANVDDVDLPRYRGVTLAMNVADHGDVQPTLDRAIEAGATLVKPATKVEWGGTSGYFADPDGYLWEVACNPFFERGGDGRIKIP
jgi:catechol 2,3-dioxygenase-like lactoylglutathione lyase family enzyme